MLMPRSVVRIFLVSLATLGGGQVSGQDYPNRPIRFVAPAGGGSADFAARLIANALSSSLNQQVIVENRPGGGGAVAAQAVTKEPADGYTILLQANTHWLGPLLRAMPYDPVKDFVPISWLVTSPYILVVHPSLPIKSVKELVAFAKAKPGSLNYAGGNIGSVPHLSQELFKSMTGINIVYIPDKGGASGTNDLLSGRTHITVDDAPTLMPLVNAGKLRALAVTSAEPSALVPGLPTVASSGLPGYEAALIIGGFGLAGTPATLIRRLNQEMVRALNQADVKEKFLHVGQTTVGSSPEEFGAKVKADMTKWGKVIKDAGIRAD